MIAHNGITELVRRAQTADRTAVAELLARLRPDLDCLAERFGDVSPGDESASDLAQEAALRLWEKLTQFQGAANDERTAAMLHDWLEQLVRRLATNRRLARHAAKRRPERPVFSLGVPAGTDSQRTLVGLDPAESGPTPSALACAAEVDGRVRAALAALPNSTDRQILELCFFEAMSLRAVAERLDLSYDKVRERYQAGLRFRETAGRGGRQSSRHTPCGLLKTPDGDSIRFGPSSVSPKPRSSISTSPPPRAVPTRPRCKSPRHEYPDSQ